LFDGKWAFGTARHADSFGGIIIVRQNYCNEVFTCW